MTVESCLGFRLLMLHHIALIKETKHRFIRCTIGDRLARNARRYNACRDSREAALSSGKSWEPMTLEALSLTADLSHIL
jgi:hypothetical protein